MMRLVGSWPRTNVGKAMDEIIDFKKRGGKLMIRRSAETHLLEMVCQFLNMPIHQKVSARATKSKIT
jgi:uncharacterized protein (UPF0147 family)